MGLKSYKKFNEGILKKEFLAEALKPEKKCAIFAHPDDEFNILTVLDNSFDVFYLTAGEGGWRHSHYYGNPEDVKKDIIRIRRSEASDISKYFGFNHRFFNFPDVNRESSVEWDENRLEKIIQDISGDYDKVYTIGPIGREHHQHMQIALALKEICPEKVVYGNWYRETPSETGIDKYEDCPFVKKDLEFFVNALKSQGTMQGTIDFKGHILWTPQ